MKTIPKTYQVRIEEEALRAIKEYRYHGLRMRMGTGKTRTALALFEKLRESEGLDFILVLGLGRLFDNFRREAEIHLSVAPDEICFVDSAVVRTKKGREKLATTHTTAIYSLVYLSIESFQRDSKDYTKYVAVFLKTILSARKPFLILDESAMIKTPRATRTENILRLFGSDVFPVPRVELTGLLFPKSPLDLYSQMEFLKSNFWPHRNFWLFRKEFAEFKDIYIQSGRKVSVVSGYKNLDKMKALIDPHWSGVEDSELSDVFTAQHEEIFLTLPSKLAAVYEDLAGNFETTFEGEVFAYNHAMSIFIKLKQLTSGFLDKHTLVEHVKFPVIKDLLEEQIDTEEQVLIFCNYVHETQALREYLEKSPRILSADLRQEAKDELLSDFRENKFRVLISTPDTMAYGYNLQTAPNQIWLQRPLRFDFFTQGVARSAREGAKRSPTIITLTAQGTVDERLVKLNDEKKSLLEFFKEKRKEHGKSDGLPAELDEEVRRAMSVY